MQDVLKLELLFKKIDDKYKNVKAKKRYCRCGSEEVSTGKIWCKKCRPNNHVLANAENWYDRYQLDPSIRV